jgi:DNA-binding phage protein
MSARPYRSHDDATVESFAKDPEYAAAYQQGTNLVLLQPDVAAAFPTSAAVNDALKGLLKVARTAKVSRAATVRVAQPKNVARGSRKAR